MLGSKDMASDLLKELLEKYRTPKDRLYQIRATDGTLSQPLTVEAIVKDMMDHCKTKNSPNPKKRTSQKF
ncbi:MAG: hypothetical protein HYY61_03245 [Deltaproteobacteria bacterium]|nr:hypothetical protein [Deltaproteobacteria bacterium]